MRLLPRSLAGRLTVTALAAIAIALLFAAMAIGRVLERFVTEGLDERLDAQIAVIARAVRPDGSLDRSRVVDVPPFDRPGSGWAWQLTTPRAAMRSGSLDGAMLLPRPLEGPAFHHRAREGRPEPFEARGADGELVHGRRLTVRTSAGAAVVLAAGPRWVVERPLRAAVAPLLVSLAMLGIGLALALIAQLRLGLRPLARLQAMVVEVREGRRSLIEATEPTELLPLVGEVNALIEANVAGLAAARLHVANLAHGLKTPLATLRLDLAEAGRDPDGRLRAEVERLEAQVRHHLARARAANVGTIASPLVAVLPVVADLARAMERLHADKAIRAELHVPAALAVRCDPRDLDEALGNILDNAWRHARTAVSVGAVPARGIVRLTIADDGADLDDDKLAAMQSGAVRLDERERGNGQGLRIARELIELHGGRIGFSRGERGGLLVEMELHGNRTH